MPDDAPPRGKMLPDDVVAPAIDNPSRPPERESVPARPPRVLRSLPPSDTTQPDVVDAYAGRLAAETIFQPRPSSEETPALDDAPRRPIRSAAQPADRGTDARVLFTLDAEAPPLEVNPFKVGILGGTDSGKSYLFQSMVFRVNRGSFGAMAYYTKNDRIAVYEAEQRPGSPVPRREDFKALNPDEFVKLFKRWYRLPRTVRENQRWYRLQLPFRHGWLGGVRSRLEVAFLDGSGEYLASGSQSDEDFALWKEAFVDAEVMVFCLPMWAAFPYFEAFKQDDLVDHREDRRKRLDQFSKVEATYRRFRERAGLTTKPVRVIVALTMADDVRCSYDSQQTWITAYSRDSGRTLRMLRKGSGIARYLATARQISYELLEACDSPDLDEVVSNLPKLDFGFGKPWLIPVSAVQGHQLSQIEELALDDDAREEQGAPVPVHVELPLLITLCQRYNALA